MTLYLLKRTDFIGYDEYDALIVRAQDQEHALQVAKDAHGGGLPTGFTEPANFTVEVVDPDGEPDVILASFNAG